MAATWHWRDTHAGPVSVLASAPQHPASHHLRFARHQDSLQQSNYYSGGGFSNNYSTGVANNLFHKHAPQLAINRPMPNSPSSTWYPATNITNGSSSLFSSSPSSGLTTTNMVDCAPRTAGRKRSRDEMSESTPDEDSRSPASISSLNAPSPDARTDNPQQSQYAEEVSERLRSSSLVERPLLESRKSMRLLESSASSSTSLATTAAHSSTLPAASSALPVPGSADQLGFKSLQDPSIDEATLTLGIGWSSLPATSTMAAATRGWAKHIENNFPVRSVRFVWHNASLPVYLVSAVSASGSPGYFLFNEDLNYGQLVAKSWERALDNLRERPMCFDGMPITLASSSSSSSSSNPAPDIEMSG